MRFRAEHRFGAAPDAVIALLVDPEFHRQLRLPDLSQPEIVADEPDRLRLRYQYVGTLDPIAQRLLRGRKLTWVQELTVDREARTGRLTFSAEADPKRLHGNADVVFRPDGEGAVRRLDGELVVNAPLVGAMAERRILPGLLRRLDIEAQALDERLRPPP